MDEAAATFVAALLAPGGNRIIRNLTTLGPEVADIVAGQLWLQVRDYPWRDKPRAVAKNVLMDTRRAVLRDYGASTHRRAALVPIPSPDDVARGDHALERVTFEAQVPDLALLQLLVWATAWRVLRPQDAALLWDLVLVDADLRTTLTKPLSHGGAGSKQAAARFADNRGVTTRHIRRRRDLAVSALRGASDAFRGDFDIGRAVGATTPAPTAGPGDPASRPVPGACTPSRRPPVPTLRPNPRPRSAPPRKAASDDRTHPRRHRPVRHAKPPAARADPQPAPGRRTARRDLDRRGDRTGRLRVRRRHGRDRGPGGRRREPATCRRRPRPAGRHVPPELLRQVLIARSHAHRPVRARHQPAPEQAPMRPDGWSS